MPFTRRLDHPGQDTFLMVVAMRATPPNEQQAGRTPDGGVDFEACRRIAASLSEGSERVVGLQQGARKHRRRQTLQLRWSHLKQALRLWWRHGRANLRRQTLRSTVRERAVPDCGQCPDNCCRGPNLVSLRLQDMARLLDAGLGWAIVAPGSHDTKRMLELEGPGSARPFPVLARKADGSCVFLDAHNRCSIHPIRPLTCRRFPYVISDDLVQIGYSQSCPSWRHGNDAECQALEQASVDSYNARVQDLWTLAFAPALLERLGLAAHLPGLHFARVLRRHRHASPRGHPPRAREDDSDESRSD